MLVLPHLICVNLVGLEGGPGHVLAQKWRCPTSWKTSAKHGARAKETSLITASRNAIGLPCRLAPRVKCESRTHRRVLQTAGISTLRGCSTSWRVLHMLLFMGHSSCRQMVGFQISYLIIGSGRLEAVEDRHTSYLCYTKQVLTMAVFLVHPKSKPRDDAVSLH